MERIIDEKIREQIINFGAFEYDVPKMSNILGWNRDEVKGMYFDKDSEFSKLYKMGKDKADYVIDLKLFEMAQGGDLKALAEFEKRKAEN